MLVGRTCELEALGAALARACSGTAAAVAIAGEPGVGKSRLLAELEAMAATRCLVLAGRSGEFEGDVPFGLVRDVLDAHVADLEHRLVRRLGPDVVGELAGILPGLAVAGHAPV